MLVLLSVNGNYASNFLKLANNNQKFEIILLAIKNQSTTNVS